ncbi:class I SAM-dependent methyltransferase [Tropicimonas sp. IMCC6043]|uniref:class I SAM-dependent methyltransferase n=1 Tax=Tropicimonas sp. IMCC6043 TaxID=2510645 RepID=UPI0013EC3E56|nr:class I SAM-dependent methyltransferase [Tropicimonas sp. IMCC6043]
MDFAETYDSVLVPVIFQPWARELIRRVPPRDGMRFLDLACGTGAATREVLATGVSPTAMTGVDMAAGMLDVARAKTRAASVEVNWIEADAAKLPFPDDQFDTAYCQQALQFFPDRAQALKELRRVLVGGASVAFCVTTGLEENPLLRSQADALERHVDEAAGAAVRAICSLSDTEEIRALFEDAGFEDVEVDRVSLTLSHPDGRVYAAGAMGGMHTGDKIAGMPREAVDACFDDFLAGLGECFDGVGIEFPHVANVVVARA